MESNDLKASCIWPLVKDDDGGAAHGSRVGYQTAHEEPRAAAPFKQKDHAHALTAQSKRVASAVDSLKAVLVPDGPILGHDFGCCQDSFD
jgi:hypothetical protein